jgi:hypothetical protein
MKIVLIIIGALISIGFGVNRLGRKEGMDETLKKLPGVGCLIYLVFGVMGGLIGWLIYSIF